MKRLLFGLAVGLGVDGLLRRRRRDQLLILMYHGVIEEALTPFCWHQLPVAAFREQMAWVASHYTVLPLETALTLRAEGALPDHACAITFDDGYLNVATHAVPVLKEFGLPATVFLVTDLVGTEQVPWPDRLWLAFQSAPAGTLDLVDLGIGRFVLPAERDAALEYVTEVLKDRPVAEKNRLLDGIVTRLGATGDLAAGPFAMLSWPVVEALNAEGLTTFGPHSLTHEILSRCDAAEIERQVRGSCEAVAERLGRHPRVFAYPNGRRQDFDARAEQALQRALVPWALTTEKGLVAKDDPPLGLRRISVGADLSFARFRLLCAGV